MKEIDECKNEAENEILQVNLETPTFVQIAAHREIHVLTKSILQPYETLPLILNNQNNNTNNQFDLIYEDTTSLFQECSDRVDKTIN